MPPTRRKSWPRKVPEPPTTRTLLRAATTRLAEAGIEAPAREARWLAARAADTDLTGLMLGAPVDAARFAALLARRAAREPLAYVLGEAPFADLSLAVSPATLIPRADTEVLLAAARQARPTPESVRRMLDLGTGTGCLLLCALRAWPLAFGVGIDKAPAACRLARHNAARLGLEHRAAFLCADWAAPLAGRFDLVLSNPPYIETAEIAHLMPEVARHEPTLALDGGPDGLAAYRRLLPDLPALLAPGGLAVLELGAGQADTVSDMASLAGFHTARRPDSGGHDRALLLWRD